MARNLVCSECGGNLKRGYVAQQSPSGWTATGPDFWIEEAPKWNFLGLTSVKNRTKDEIVAYRCARCGLVKFYAGPDNSSEK